MLLRVGVACVNLGVVESALLKALGVSMEEVGNGPRHKLLFLTSTVLIAAILVAASIEAASNTLPNFAGLSRSASHSLRSVVHGVSHAAKFTASIVDVASFIKPANHTRLSVITPLPVIKLTSITVPATPQPFSSGMVGSATPAHVATLQSDLYAWGNCTWWVALRRAQSNDPIPASWGNAATWARRAAQDDYLVDHQPSPGAIMQLADTAGGLGHVAFVEQVDGNGTWHISEMNVLGLDVVDHKAEPLSAAVNYNFIHDRT